jgi:hypothetical protein
MAPPEPQNKQQLITSPKTTPDDRQLITRRAFLLFAYGAPAAINGGWSAYIFSKKGVAGSIIMGFFGGLFWPLLMLVNPLFLTAPYAANGRRYRRRRGSPNMPFDVAVKGFVSVLLITVNFTIFGRGMNKYRASGGRKSL